MLRILFYSGKGREFLLEEGMGGCKKVKPQRFVDGIHAMDRNWVWSISR